MEASNKSGIGRTTILVVISLIFLITFIANPQIIVDWRTYSFDDGTYSHAYLIPFIIGYFFWRAAEQQQLQLRWNTLIFIFFVLTLLGFLILQVAQLGVLSRIFVPLVLLTALGSLFRLNSSLIVPLTLLWFITPIWMPLNGILQKLSVFAVTHMMSFTNIPFYVEGNMVHIPSGIFEIADGCSGLRYFIVAVALAVIYCHLNLAKKRSMLIFFAAAVIGALITNWIRIALLIYIGDYTEMQSSLMEDHNLFGWYIFIPFIALLFYFGSKLERDLPVSPAPLTQPQSLPGKPLLSVIAVLLVISGSSIQLLNNGKLNWSIAAIDLDAEPVTASYQQITPVIFVASGIDISTEQFGAQQISKQHYLFAGETDGHKPDYYQNSMVPDGWRRVDRKAQGSAEILTVHNATGQFGLIMYWYQIGNSKTASSGLFKRYRLMQAFSLNPSSELHWYFIGCQQHECKDELQLLTDIKQAAI